MKSSIIFLCVFIIYSQQAHSQWHDMNFIIGYEGDEVMKINFENNTPEIIPFPCNINFAWTASTMSDKEGNLAFFTNGIEILNNYKAPIENGDSINYNNFTEGYFESGYSVLGDILTIPHPNSLNQYNMIHGRVDTNSVFGVKVDDLLLTRIDMDLNSGSGQVLTKNEIIQESFMFDESAAVKHANGRDWWVITSDMSNNNYYKLLVSPEGVEDKGFQTIGEKPPFDWPDSGDDSGHNLFSPDGSLYIENDIKSGTRIFDFDRCTGQLSNFRWIQYPEELSYGAAISPNSRYLFTCTNDKIFQFDLQAEDIAASMQTVAEYDGFNPPVPVILHFYQMQLAPDGKIYMQGVNYHLHVIHHPNMPGAACDVRQHDLIFPNTIGFTWNNFPNYRLGPIDGSTCDSLGINNVPLAHFTYEADTISPQQIRFTDNSFYEPAEWDWDFGDGSGSTAVDPQHSYAATGIYEVCLTVSNPYGSDTFCRELEITTVGTTVPISASSGLTISPNPAWESVRVQYPAGISYGIEIVLSDATGREVAVYPVGTGQTSTEISIRNLPGGFYLVSVRQQGQVVHSAKLVIGS